MFILLSPFSSSVLGYFCQAANLLFFSSLCFSFRFAVSFYFSFSFLIVHFLSFSPCGTLIWLDVITAYSCCSGNIPREITSNLNKLPKEVNHAASSIRQIKLVARFMTLCVYPVYSPFCFCRHHPSEQY
jgi:hypothetical protein